MTELVDRFLVIQQMNVFDQQFRRNDMLLGLMKLLLKLIPCQSTLRQYEQ